LNLEYIWRIKMKKTTSLIAILTLFIAFVFSACGGKSDADLTKEVNEKLKAAPGGATTAATVKDGVVTLSGLVPDQTTSKNLETVAKVDGVKSVTNNIQIRPAIPPMPMPPSGPPPPMMTPGTPPSSTNQAVPPPTTKPAVSPATIKPAASPAANKK
jgi:hypothetical protein